MTDGVTRAMQDGDYLVVYEEPGGDRGVADTGRWIAAAVPTEVRE